MKESWSANGCVISEQRWPPLHVGQTGGDKRASLGRLDLLTSEGPRTIHLLSSHNRRVCQDEVSVRAAWLAANMPISPDFIEVNLPKREHTPPRHLLRCCYRGKDGFGKLEREGSEHTSHC